MFDRWRKAGAVAAARINPLETCGNDDLIGVPAGRPDLILMSKVATPQHDGALIEVPVYAAAKRLLESLARS